MDQNSFRRVTVILLLVFISAGFVAMIRPFVMTFLLAAIFSGLTHPLYERLNRDPSHLISIVFPNLPAN